MKDLYQGGDKFDRTVKIARIGFLGFCLIVFAICIFHIPQDAVHAQNNGTTGTFTVAQVAFTNVNTLTATSSIFQNVGQSAHYFSWCITQSAATHPLDLFLEESFDGSTNWIPIASTHIVTTVDPTQCGILQAGGYYQNVRATLSNNVNLETVNAWYQSTSGPISFSPSGTSIFGATAPVVCNKNRILTFTGAASSEAIPALAGRIPVVCGFQISYTAAAVIGSFDFTSAFGAGCASTLGPWWTVSTLVTTSQIITMGSGQGSLIVGSQNAAMCVVAGGAQNATVSISYTYI